jgi:hypothetical protein
MLPIGDFPVAIPLPFVDVTGVLAPDEKLYGSMVCGLDFGFGLVTVGIEFDELSANAGSAIVRAAASKTAYFSITIYLYSASLRIGGPLCTCR